MRKDKGLGGTVVVIEFKINDLVSNQLLLSVERVNWFVHGNGGRG